MILKEHKYHDIQHIMTYAAPSFILYDPLKMATSLH